MSAVAVAAAVVTGLLAWAVAGLARSHARLARTVAELEARQADLEAGRVGEIRPSPAVPGSEGATPRAPAAPVSAVPAGPAAALEIEGVGPDGDVVRIPVGGVDHATVLAFLSTGCGTCGEFWRAFTEPDRPLPGVGTELVVVTKGEEAEVRAKVAALAPPGVHTVMSTEAWGAWRVPGSPYFVLVDGPSGAVVGEGSGTSWPQVAALLSSALSDGARGGNKGPNGHHGGS